MAGVAFNGSNISDSTKSGHVTYDIERWVPSYCTGWDQYGNCISTGGGYWTSAGSGSTGAKITGSKVQSNSNVYVNQKPIACVGDVSTSENWRADPPVPSGGGDTRIVNIRPSTSGSGSGSISSGSTKVFVGGKAVAFIGSDVRTHLGTQARIDTGSTSVFVG
ncbi:PAAR domain-containing protein [Paenibacillus agilis]|uniref:Uncharacterized protein n=1 Tax=Paenibacillus agilis TaxID=3020863 RepID=A0A559IEL3_9BACL|nr:PAAR domain-containing protein [Paenibacillus agilis]TVX86085.1 hypothetical protein FPZ44_24425 [Paenibacillus agilis]